MTINSRCFVGSRIVSDHNGIGWHNDGTMARCNIIIMQKTRHNYLVWYHKTEICILTIFHILLWYSCLRNEKRKIYLGFFLMEYRTMDSFMFFMLANSCSVDRRPLIQNSIHLFSFISIHSFINSFIINSFNIIILLNMCSCDYHILNDTCPYPCMPPRNHLLPPSCTIPNLEKVRIYLEVMRFRKRNKY